MCIALATYQPIFLLILRWPTTMRLYFTTGLFKWKWKYNRTGRETDEEGVWHDKLEPRVHDFLPECAYQ